MPDAAPAGHGVYEPRRPQASPLYRLASDHLHRLQTVCDGRFAREYGPWRPLVGQVAAKFLACGVLEHGTACPTSHGVMRIVAFLTHASVTDRILAHLRARSASADHAGASDWSRRDRPPTSTAVRTALTVPARDGGHGTARHAALARSAIAPECSTDSAPTPIEMAIPKSDAGLASRVAARIPR